jgi:hypothetical protein
LYQIHVEVYRECGKKRWRQQVQDAAATLHRMHLVMVIVPQRRGGELVVLKLAMVGDLNYN